jgi:hypothetical protein
VTTTIDPVEDVAGDDRSKGRSPLRLVLITALATALLLAAAGGVVYFVGHRSPAPAPVAEQAPAAAAPSASPTPAEQFLDLWHRAAPGVAARQPDYYWTRIGTSACNLIGVPGVSAYQLTQVLGTNPQLMSVTEATQFLGVANAKLCPDRDYVPAPTLTVPILQVPLIPDLGGGSSSSSGWIPSGRHTSSGSASAPNIPGSGSSSSVSSSSGSSSGHSSSGGGHGGTVTVPPSLSRQPSGDLHAESLNN